MRPLKYFVVDVFTEVPLAGNPLAVFPDGTGLSDTTMQMIAKEINLSETTFVFPATDSRCSAKVRIFTPATELSFAGHPTIGTAFVLRREELVRADANSFFLEENIGPVNVRVERILPERFWLTTPPISVGRTYDRGLVAEALGLTESDLLPDVLPQLLSAGNPNVYVALRDKRAVDRAWIDRAGAHSIQGDSGDSSCIFVFATSEQGAYSRMFAPQYGIAEDPATGSATGPLAAYMIRNGLIAGTDGTRFVSEQGTKMGRPSFLSVMVHGDSGADGIEVGGHVVQLVDATMSL